MNYVSKTTIIYMRLGSGCACMISLEDRTGNMPNNSGIIMNNENLDSKHETDETLKEIKTRGSNPIQAHCHVQ